MKRDNLKTETLVIAHRGDTQSALENTLEAFSSALALGVDGIELDVRLTKDRRVVVFHDQSLDRLARRKEWVESSPWSDLRSVRLTNASRIPLLEEVLELVRDRLWLNIEIKTQGLFTDPLVTQILKDLKRFNLKDSILLSSFQPAALWNLRMRDSTFHRGYLLEKWPHLHRWVLPTTAPYSVHFPLPDASDTAVRHHHDAGRKFFVWTVNYENDMNRLIATGVDGLITDKPRTLLKLLGRTS